MNGRPSSTASAGKPRVVHVIQGEFAVVDQPNVVLTTLLGSCVAACLHDPVAGVGGMNHFLLPGDKQATNDSLKYGVNAMELLINGMLQRGAARGRIEAKLFGGANVMHHLGEIGRENAEFARGFLNAEGIPCSAESLGGNRARRIRFTPSTGHASQLLIDPSHADVIRAERRTAPPPPPIPANDDIELF